MNRQLMLKKKLLILLSLLFLVGNGGFSLSNAGNPDDADIFGSYINEIPMFVRDDSSSFDVMKINPFLYTTIDHRDFEILPAYSIMTHGVARSADMANFLMINNPGIALDHAMTIAAYYYQEAAFEGVNQDIAFCQMCLETGFLSFSGTVKPVQNNFCGLGTISNNHPGEYFSSKQLGIRAHIQHLKAYASTEAMNNKLIDTRYHFVKRGSAGTVDGLTGKWASDPEYAKKIKGLIKRLHKIMNESFYAMY